jgi:Holliday junction resolvase RusA-like endonuclease
VRLCFTIDAPPVGKGRAQFANGHAYTPKKTRDYERLVKVLCMDHMRRNGIPVFTGPVTLDLRLRLTPPKSTTKAKRAAMLSGLTPPMVKPDASNALKAIEDAMNAVAYKDDVQIVELHVLKIYAETAGVDVMVESYVYEQAG